MRKATKTAASWLGVVAGIAGFEHGYFEFLQGNIPTPSLVFPSWGPPCVPEEIWHNPSSPSSAAWRGRRSTVFFSHGGTYEHVAQEAGFKVVAVGPSMSPGRAAEYMAFNRGEGWFAT